MKVVHIITGLGRGGAPNFLSRLIRKLSEGYQHEVISLAPVDYFEHNFDGLNIPIHSVHIRPGVPSLKGLFRLKRQIQQSQADLMHCWMYHANIAGVLASDRQQPIVWGIRHSLHESGREKMLTRLLIRSGRYLSSRVNSIVYCSRTSQRQHEELKYPERKSVFIPNGFDCSIFCRDPSAGRRLREWLGIPEEAVVIGHAARFHPMKNHFGLIRAFRKVLHRHSQTYLVMAGRGVDMENQRLASEAKDAKVSKNIRFIGEQSEMHTILAGCDIYVSPSMWGEAFPNVLGEAMACGVPCVATDVGDSAEIVGIAGRIVPPGDDGALADGISELVFHGRNKREKLGLNARQRIVGNYSLSAIARSYQKLYDDVVHRPR